jgi:hypothetical protein
VFAHVRTEVLFIPFGLEVKFKMLQLEYFYAGIYTLRECCTIIMM